ncbi:hypothetical protein AVEN_55502-1 [Araneus ventricosus]|uniref:Uncharacterized protein n=1 Tax=Araneus ventricosus TaxID=182803 RepID=A0A4Y2CB71_ARAVE|nr:hypothetical protein AVEN_55502-1 [Araneus ventricosus]
MFAHWCGGEVGRGLSALTPVSSSDIKIHDVLCSLTGVAWKFGEVCHLWYRSRHLTSKYTMSYVPSLVWRGRSERIVSSGTDLVI